jgi:hypothetical protein
LEPEQGFLYKVSANQLPGDGRQLFAGHFGVGNCRLGACGLRCCGGFVLVVVDWRCVSGAWTHCQGMKSLSALLIRSLSKNWSRNLGVPPVMGGSRLGCLVKAVGTTAGRHSQDGCVPVFQQALRGLGVIALLFSCSCSTTPPEDAADAGAPAGTGAASRPERPSFFGRSAAAQRAGAAPASLLGTWQQVGGGDTLELQRGSRAILRNGDGESLAGSFTTAADGRAIIRMTGKDPAMGEVTLSAVEQNGQLELTHPDGEMFRFQKVR